MNKIRKELKTIFAKQPDICELIDTLPINDADDGLPLCPLAVDAKGADAKSLSNCNWVHTILRQYGDKVKAAAFYKVLAYLVWYEHKRTKSMANPGWCIKRFYIPTKTRQTIADVDRSDGAIWSKIVEEGNHMLEKVPYGYRLETYRKFHKSAHGISVNKTHQRQRQLVKAMRQLAVAVENVETAQRDYPKSSPKIAMAIKQRNVAADAVSDAREKLEMAKHQHTPKHGYKPRKKHKPHVFDTTVRNGILKNYLEASEQASVLG